MQTFLPYPSYKESAAVLDRQRLGKQRVETKQILQVLTGEQPQSRWRNHPAVQMWRGYAYQLARYGVAICQEWRQRGYNDSLLPWFQAQELPRSLKPWWLGYEYFHQSHRSNLLRKFPKWYNQFGWEEPNWFPYFWPRNDSIPNLSQQHLREIKDVLSRFNSFERAATRLGFRYVSDNIYIDRNRKLVLKRPKLCQDKYPPKAIPTIELVHKGYKVFIQPLADTTSRKANEIITNTYRSSSNFGDDAHDSNVGLFKGQLVSFDW